MPFAFTNIGGFALNYLSVADFSGSSVTLDNITVGDSSGAPSVPEIDPATGGSALSLLAGVLAMIEQRRRRRGTAAGLTA